MKPQAQLALSATRHHVTAPLGDPFADLEAGRFPELALTAYLPATAQGVFDAGYHAAGFSEVARHAEDRLGPRELEALRRESAEVAAYLEVARPPQHLGLAVFACRPAGLLEVWRLRGEVEADLQVAQRLNPGPIRERLVVQPPALVLVADKEKARVFSVVLEHVVEQVEFTGREVHVRASPHIRQHKQEERARANLAVVVGWLVHADDTFVKRVYLAGPPEARSELRRLLPPRFLAKVAGELHLPLYASPGEIAEQLRGLV